MSGTLIVRLDRITTGFAQHWLTGSVGLILPGICVWSALHGFPHFVHSYQFVAANPSFISTPFS